MKYTVVTGASSGIGYETALAFAARGKNLIVAARRKEQLEELKSEITRIYPDVDVVIRATDLSYPRMLISFMKVYKGSKSKLGSTMRDLATLLQWPSKI
ncbi:short chain dehydrogenase [Paenibacillus sp. 1_12]|nr:short chain dehydrogenase [Paenibacillus sp. 1_12]